MASLIHELQQQAMDGKTPVSDLLRKALAISKKLGLPSLEKWIGNELNGYKENVPSYRNVSGKLRAFHPARGYIQVAIPDPEQERLLTERHLTDPIAVVEELFEGGKDHGLVSKFSTETAMKINPEAAALGIVPELRIDSSQLKKVLDAVRTKVLEWSLQLEKDGILGEDISFTDEEKKTASGNVTNYGTIIHGDSVVGSQYQKNSPGAVQVSVNEGIDKEGIELFLKLMADNLNALSLEKEERTQIEAEISTIKSQIESSKPSNSVIHRALKSIRNVAEGCVGSLIASGMILEINRLLPM